MSNTGDAFALDTVRSGQSLPLSDSGLGEKRNMVTTPYFHRPKFEIPLEPYTGSSRQTLH